MMPHMKSVFRRLLCASSRCAAALTLLMGAAHGKPTVIIGINELSLPPYIMEDGPGFASQPGLSVELVRVAANACQVDIVLQRLSAMRLLQALKVNAINAVIQLSYSKERDDYASFPMKDNQPDANMRLTHLKYSFFTNANQHISWDGQHLTGTDLPVGAIFGWSIVKDLQKLQIPVDTAIDFKSNLAKLKTGRISAFAIQPALAQAYLKGRQDIVELTPAIIEKDYFLPFSHAYVAEKPEVVQCLWRQIATYRDTLMLRREPVYHELMLR